MAIREFGGDSRILSFFKNSSCFEVIREWFSDLAIREIATHWFENSRWFEKIWVFNKFHLVLEWFENFNDSAIREFQRFENSHVLKWFNDSRFPTNWQTFEWKLKEFPTLSWFSESGNVFYWSHSTWIPFLFENWCCSCRNPSSWSWDNWWNFQNFNS